MTLKKILLLPFLLSVSLALQAQDPEFTQVMATPVYFNPAFAGFQQNLRAALHYRLQWPSVSGAFITVAASADMGIPKINSGVNLMLVNDQAGDGQLTTTAVNATYAYELKLLPQSGIRFGAEGSFFQRSMNTGQLRYGNQIDPKTGFVYNTQDSLQGAVETTSLIPNLGAGVVYYNRSFYAGLAVYNIFEPEISFSGNPASHLLRRTDLQAGYFIKAGNLTINPYLLAMHQGNFSQVLPGANVSMGLFTFGASFRMTDPNADAINFLVGLAKGKFKFCYSYDATVSDARAAATGSHEFSLIFQLSKPHDVTENAMIGHMRTAY